MAALIRVKSREAAGGADFLSMQGSASMPVAAAVPAYSYENNGMCVRGFSRFAAGQALPVIPIRILRGET
jgi:hypothetical protein